MGKDVIIYDNLGLIPEPSPDFSTKARANLEEEGGSTLASQPRRHTGSKLQHPLNPIRQCINHRTKPEMEA